MTFDFIESICNNWLNQNNKNKTFHSPNLVNFKADSTDYPLKFVSASNVSTPFKEILLNHHFSEPLTFNDERFILDSCSFLVSCLASSARKKWETE